jgi:DNA-binding NarL/FixJ family response regulator
MTETKITVMLVDDHAIVRGGVAAYLSAQKDIEVVGEAASGKEAVELAEKLAPDVILMDLLMPQMDGVEATWRVRRVSPRSQVIVLTSYHEDTHIFPAIKAGALSYLLKDIEPQELAEAIRSASRGEAAVHPKVASRMMAELRGDQDQSINSYNALTEREQEVLRCIADGMSNAQIAEALVISEKTVKSHVSNILNKLHLSDRTQAAVFAWREGIVRKDN